MTKYSKYLFRVFIIAIPLIIFIYSIWYWSSDYQKLKIFYKGINPNFYKSTLWESFFTVKVKSQGNYWCLLALLASISWSFILWKYKWTTFPKFHFKKNKVFTYSGIAILGIILSVIANIHVKYSTDEIFSALNFASLPSFQTISYYVLPNNHILFNFINGFNFFGRENLVQSGRLISLISYIIVLCSSWYFLEKWIQIKWFRILSLFILASQFPVWGFSGQARGYELLLMLSIVSVITFWDYWIENKKHLLPIHAICNLAGILTIPTYFYWWFGLIITALLFMIFEKRIDWGYIRASILSALMTVLLLLPLLTFSGISSVIDNTYVHSSDSNLLFFTQHLYKQGYFIGLFNEWFCFIQSKFFMGVILSVLPIIMLFYKIENKKYKALSILFISMIISFFIIAIIMRKLPFYRNLIAHAYLVLMFILISLYPLLKNRFLQIFACCVLSIIFVYSIITNYNRMSSSLYYYDVNKYFNDLTYYKSDFKNGSSIYLDEECFYWKYILESKDSKKSLKVMRNKSLFNKQDYCIISIDSSLPEDTTLYSVIEKVEDFNILKRNK